MKRTSTRILNVSVILSTVFIASLTSSAYAISDARKKLNSFFTDVNTIQGAFVQQLYGKKGTVKETSNGQLYIQRPGKFRWIYADPEPQQIISDGKNIWIYDQELDQVTVRPLNKAINNTPAAILMQKSIPDKQFKVTQMDDKTSNWDWFYLQPHRKTADFKALQLGMDEQGTLKQMVLYDKIGQKTVITFDTTANQTVTSDHFDFKPPAGVDVIGVPQT